MTIYQAGNINTTGLTVPDLYVQIVPPSTINLNGVPSNILGVVDTATYGPVGVATICSGIGDFQKAFGTVQNRPYDAGTVVAVANLQGANNFRVVRVTDGTDTAASNAITNAATLSAKYTGSLGNQITTTVLTGTAANSLKMVVYQPYALPEIFDNLAANSTTFWPAVANAVANGTGPLRGPSQIINATLTGGTGLPVANTVYTFAGGTDGVASANSVTLIGQDVAGARTGMYALRSQGCSVGVLADMTAYTEWTTMAAMGLSEGIYWMTSGPAGETIASATANKAAAGLDSYAVKLMLGDFLYWQDPYTQSLRLISPTGFSAGRLANLSPEQSGLNKQMYGVAGSQKCGVPGTPQQQSYSAAELTALASTAIDVIDNPQPGGNYWGLRFGRNSASSNAIHNDSYTRLTNYIAASLNAGMGLYVGQLINVNLFANVKATLVSFLQNMLGQGLLGSTVAGVLTYGVVCDTSNNPFSRTSIGYLQADCQVQYQAINEFFLVNLQGGQTVNVTIGSSTAATS